MSQEGKGTKFAAYAALAGAIAAITPQVGEWLAADAELRVAEAQQLSKALAKEAKINDKVYEEVTETLELHATEIERLQELCKKRDPVRVVPASMAPIALDQDASLRTITDTTTSSSGGGRLRPLHPRALKRSDIRVKQAEIREKAEELYR